MNKFLDLILKSKNNRDSLSFHVCGDSMSPVIKNGDRIQVLLQHRKLEINDIILYRRFDTHLTVHRIINIYMDTEGKANYLTKGDNNSIEDQYIVTEECIIGIVEL